MCLCGNFWWLVRSESGLPVMDGGVCVNPLSWMGDSSGRWETVQGCLLVLCDMTALEATRYVWPHRSLGPLIIPWRLKDVVPLFKGALDNFSAARRANFVLFFKPGCWYVREATGLTGQSRKSLFTSACSTFFMAAARRITNELWVSGEEARVDSNNGSKHKLYLHPAVNECPKRTV